MGTADEVLKGNIRAAARLISDLENQIPGALDELDLLYPHTGKAHKIGITGSPGIGKSTLTSSLVSVFRQRQMTVGVLAVDPSSPFTCGAILGDRIRMQEHCSDKGVFIRSIASRGYVGGLAGVVSSAIHVVDALGKEIILVETVGAGQAEVDIDKVVDTTVLVLSVESGDSIQIMKAGIMEIADIFVVNKADKGGAELAVAEIEIMLAMKSGSAGGWKPGIVITEATTGKGVDKLADGILRHRAYLASSGRLMRYRHEIAKQELLSHIEYLIKSYLREGRLQSGSLEKLVDEFAQRKVGAQFAARKILEMFIREYTKDTN